MTRRTTIILAGAGHAHLFVVSRAETLVSLGARVVLIEPSEFWYSGLASGMLGGMYEPAEDRLDPRMLIEAHGGEFVRERVESVDSDARRVRLADGTELAYDLLSINVGSRVPAAFSEATDDPDVWRVKPSYPDAGDPSHQHRSTRSANTAPRIADAATETFAARVDDPHPYPHRLP